MPISDVSMAIHVYQGKPDTVGNEHAITCCYCNLLSDPTAIMTTSIINLHAHVPAKRFKISKYYYNCFMTLCPGLPRWVGTRRINHCGFCWSRHDGVAVASAEPHASYLHFAPEDNHTSTSVRFFMGRMPFLTTNQQHQSTEGQKHWSPHAKRSFYCLLHCFDIFTWFRVLPML